MAHPAREAPQEVGVYRSCGDLASFSHFTKARDIVEHPSELRSREVRINDETSFGTDHVFRVGRFFPFLALGGGSSVLPDDRIVHGARGFSVPNNHGFALIGDADRCDIRTLRSAPTQTVLDGSRDAFPDVFGLVLDPAGFWINLSVFLIHASDRFASAAQETDRRSGCALVDGQNIFALRGADSPCGFLSRCFLLGVCHIVTFVREGSFGLPYVLENSV